MSLARENPTELESAPIISKGTLQNHGNDDTNTYIPPVNSDESDMPGLEDVGDVPTQVSQRGGGDVVLIMDLPEVYTVGYDSLSFTAKYFGGVRDIPKGPHLFWLSHPNGMSARCGFWIESTSRGQVHVLQWDKFNETLGDAPKSEANIQAQSLPEFRDKLVPYSDPSAKAEKQGDLEETKVAANLKIWQQLTNTITSRVLKRLTGQTDDHFMVHTADRVKGAVLMAGEIELEQSISTTLFQSRELGFIFDQHAKTYSANRIGAERSTEAIDSTTYILSTMRDNDLGDSDVAGELQFAYVTGIHLGNDSCIQQWWYMLLKLVFKAYSLAEQRPILMSTFLRTVTAQVSYAVEWLDTSILDQSDSQSRELRLSLIIYKRRLDEMLQTLGDSATPDHLAVSTTFARLENAVAALGWDIEADYVRKGKVTMEDGEEIELEIADLEAEDERGEWAPEIVELDEDGRQKDLVSWTS